MSNYESLERALQSAGEAHSEIPLPPAELDMRITRGIEQGKKERLRARRLLRRRLWSAAAACLLLMTCVFGIRLSPAFASMLRDIPGMETFVNFIRSSNDRGLGLALDNEFVQPLAISDEYGGISFTVEGMIADENRVVIFYSINSGSDQKLVVLDRLQIKAPDGKELGAMSSYGDIGIEQELPFKGLNKGYVDIQMENGSRVPDAVTLKAQLKLADPDNPAARYEGPDLDATEPSEAVEPARPNDRFYEVTIPIDQSKFAGMKREYHLNQTITVEGQRINFVKATVTPLQVRIEVKSDPANSKEVFGAGDIRLTDENGEQWKSFWSMGNVDDGATIGFESNFFRKPKELYLEGEWFRALDKDKMDVVVDMDRQELIHKPDSLLKLRSITPFGKYKKLTLSMLVDHETDNMMYGGMLESKFKDASGKEYDMADIPGGVISGSSGRGAPNEQESYYYLNDEDYEQPLAFRVYQYPSYIRQPYKIQIK
ncbi:DUF4179 domain-containing protein [Cohnella herbarum]|uniref:DUF4179 domain-containing protein n=1 Tax=Cohnella herbarum TaxID=2728023 RepID=A0A7Z2ZMR7_9BACL|nr:DUF4179 domain-containing protein [Cohnella herbarum]QJD85358.1 DUF4179 domain-containing protein [Cohnella herbarum]